MSIVGVYLRILFKDSFKGTFKGDRKSKNIDEDQSTKHFFGGATKNKSEDMDEDQSTKHFFGGSF